MILHSIVYYNMISYPLADGLLELLAREGLPVELGHAGLPALLRLFLHL